MSRFMLPRAQWFSSLGVPGAGWKLYFFAATTSTPQAVYSDAALTTPITQPVTADATGTWVQIFLSPLPISYKVQLKDAAGVQIWEVDNFTGMPDALTGYVPYSGDNGLLITGKTAGTGSTTWAQIEARNSDAGDTHAGIAIANAKTSGAVNTEEGAIGWNTLMDNGVWFQNAALFVRNFGDNANHLTYQSVAGFHQVGAPLDYTTQLWYSNGSMVEIAGQTSTLPWTATAPNAGFVKNVGSRLEKQAVLVGATRNYTLATDFVVDAEGKGSFGDCDGAGNPNNRAICGYSGGKVIFHGQNLQTTSFLDIEIKHNTLSLFGGNVTPGADNSSNFGSGALRWKEIFAVAGAINTSDATLKTVRDGEAATAQERAWAQKIKSMFVPFFWNDALAEKGAGARIHFGVLAQYVIAAGQAAGLDPYRYAFICRDQKTRKVTRRVYAGQRQKYIERTMPKQVVELLNGVATLVETTETVREAAYEELPVFYPDGNPVIDRYTERDSTGGLQFKQRARTYQLPLFEDIYEDREMEELVVDAKGEPEYIHSLRYSELFAFLFAAGAL